jgi:hypothetical protein
VENEHSKINNAIKHKIIDVKDEDSQKNIRKIFGCIAAMPDISCLKLAAMLSMPPLIFTLLRACELMSYIHIELLQSTANRKIV